jgi:hypothetical protein
MDAVVENQVARAIAAAREVYAEPEWLPWVDNWLNGADQSFESARAAAWRVFRSAGLDRVEQFERAQRELELACELATAKDRGESAESNDDADPEIYAARAAYLMNRAVEESKTAALAAWLAADAAMLAAVIPALVREIAETACLVAGAFNISRGSG